MLFVLTHSSRMQHSSCITLSLEVKSMCTGSSLFTNCRHFYSLYGQIDLSHDKTKYPYREFLEITVFVNQASLQMMTSSFSHRQHFHEILNILLLVLTADTTNVHRISKKTLVSSCGNDLHLQIMIILMIIL